ncbi:MAG: flagellar hook-basal body complex protein, partial [Synergistaceae bacterium]|nr:flagellar hook-basal body complex protein [Synergistaceae bacterium]
MLRSLFTAVTGVRAHQTMLDVTGNNISNANTVGFKKDFTIFADMMYQSNKYASGAGETRGGVNPAQVGLGVSVSAIETIHTQGSAQYTGNPSDMMIQGTGFFVYKNGNVNLFSRSGATVRDANSDLVQSGTGYYLQGYEITEGVDGYERASDLSNVNIPLGKKIEAKATTEVMYQCNLNSNSKAYLPYGFADIPFNTTAGWSNASENNTLGTGKVSIADIDCELRAKTNLSSTDGTSYLTITINDGINDVPINFNMTGISEGKPSLVVDATTSATIQIGAGNNQKSLATNYDDNTGLLKFMDGNEVVFQYNVKQSMNYTSFSLSDPTN